MSSKLRILVPVKRVIDYAVSLCSSKTFGLLPCAGSACTGVYLLLMEKADFLLLRTR